VTPPALLAARNAVGVAFVLNGFGFATWVARLPEIRSRLELTNGQLGMVLLAASVGSLVALVAAGTMVERWGAAHAVRVGAALDAVGLAGIAVGVAAFDSAVWVAVALLLYGLGIGLWDVAMNVEGAGVEHRLGRTVMPRFHAGFSLGTVAGAGIGALAARLEVPLAVLLPAVGLVALVVVLATTGDFLAREVEQLDHPERRSVWAAWREPRTLLIGLMVLALAFTEGAANDWLAIALVDGYDVAHWVGVAGYAVFVSAMTLGRLLGPVLLDTFGRAATLWGTMATAAGGVLLVVLGAHPVTVVAGIALWGLGASLGFPVGMSAAADDPARAPARVSVVSTIGYTAFLTGPPLLGFLGDEVGMLQALLLVSLLLVPSALLVPAARRRPTGSSAE
jgi:fucose permease